MAVLKKYCFLNLFQQRKERLSFKSLASKHIIAMSLVRHLNYLGDIPSQIELVVQKIELRDSKSFSYIGCLKPF